MRPHVGIFLGTPLSKKNLYDCSKCPGYCCSYPRIVTHKADIARLAAHFGLSEAAAQRRFTERFVWDDPEDPIDERILKHQPDPIYGSICRFFDTDARRCTIYEARPTVCREYPNGRRCGYFEFIEFEREQQDDQDFIPLRRDAG